MPDNECILCGAPGGYPYCNEACRAADSDEEEWQTMCQSSPATSYGYELSPGDEADLDDIPQCCGGDMTAGQPDEDGDLNYVCDGGGCGTRVTITGAGIVLDVYEAA